MTDYVLTPRARADIEDIWDYTAAHWNVRQAETYIRHIQAAIEAVADEPGIARSCAEVRKGYFKFPAESHIVFFRLTQDGVEVVRILHGRMDFERHL